MCVVLLFSRSSTLAQTPAPQNERFLIGRYSFGARRASPRGQDPADRANQPRRISQVDGNGHVTAARLIEAADGIRRAFGGSSEGFNFVSGDYSVLNNGFGRITLRFVADVDLGEDGLAKQLLEEVWDISLTNDRLGFFLNAIGSVAIDFPGDTHGVSENQRCGVTWRGESKLRPPGLKTRPTSED